MINGQPTGSIKALEFAYLLSENGGRIEKTDIYTRLYNGYCSRNALWYPVETCKRYGLNIHYSSEELIYTSNNEIVSDLGLIFSKLKEDDIKNNKKLWFYQSFFLEKNQNILLGA